MLLYNSIKMLQAGSHIMKKNIITNISSSSSGLASVSEGKFYFDAKNHVFSIGGITHPDENNNEYYRLNAFEKDKYSETNRALGDHTSGGSVRFVTDAKEFYLKVTMRSASTGMQHFPNRGAYGFDVYIGSGKNRQYRGNMMQMMTDPHGFEDTVTLPEGENEVMIELPLYGGISELLIGFPEGATVSKAPDRAIAPVAFYGSSITQGGCVSRPGNMYSNIICRELDCDCLNLGFSGSAFGEQSIAEYLAGRDFSAFVMDYDYNARSLEELQNTHSEFYKTVRAAHTEEPIIIVSHPYYAAESEGDIKRKNILRETYRKAIANEENVYFVDSETFFPLEMRDLFAVDNLHPNSLGHYFMYKAIMPTLKKALEVK